MQEIHLTTREAILYLTLIGAAIGLVIGMVPLIYGCKKGKLRLGMIGFVLSIVAGGAISVILSLLATAVFVFLIARKAPIDSSSVEPIKEDDNDLTGSAL
ncbi:hypothetical protein BH20ACI2_BH20ACI2_23910 [soil metagenome]